MSRAVALSAAEAALALEALERYAESGCAPPLPAALRATLATGRCRITDRFWLRLLEIALWSARSPEACSLRMRLEDPPTP